MNDNILGKEYLNTKCVFLIFSQILSATFLVTKRIQRDIIINVLRSSYKVPLRLSNCNETRIFSTNFRTITIKFIKNPFSESRVVPCGRTDIIHTWCVQVLRSPNLFKKNYSPQEAENVVFSQRNHPVDILIFHNAHATIAWPQQTLL